MLGVAHVSRDKDLRHTRRHEVRNLGDGSDFERCSDDDNEVCVVLVMVREAVVESVWEIFAKECDIRLQQISTKSSRSFPFLPS